ncbi:hypothetical protein CFOL_v3_18364, partial [Cephalotus follicularis]
ETDEGSSSSRSSINSILVIEEDKAKSSDALAKGLSTMLTNVIKDFDSKAEDTLKSQHQLSLSIDRLTRELDQLLDDAPLPFMVQHAAKISGVRKRVSSLNSVLKSIQHRIDNIDRLLSLPITQQHENTATEVSKQH